MSLYVCIYIYTVAHSDRIFYRVHILKHSVLFVKTTKRIDRMSVN